MSNVQDGSCSAAAIALGVSPVATLALRMGAMLLRWSMQSARGHSLAVNISSNGVTIRASKLRRRSSNRRTPKPSPVSASTDDLDSTFTEITREEMRLLDVSSSTGSLGKAFEP